MQRLSCAQVWGGIGNADLDVCTSDVDASLYASACAGGRGGDIYYLSVCGSDLITRMVVADVTGHGRDVTDMSQWVYHVIEDCINDHDGDELLGNVNRIASTRGYQAITTATVVSLYPAGSELFVNYAGHPPILLRRTAQSRWQVARVPSPAANANIPLAVSANAKFVSRRFRIHRGDRLVMRSEEHTSELQSPMPLPRRANGSGATASWPLWKARNAIATVD